MNKQLEFKKLMTKDIICFYHKSDNDGKCAAAIINYTFDSTVYTKEFIGVDYNDNLYEIVLSTLNKYNVDDIVRIIIVDFCFSDQLMIYLHNMYNDKLIWIDHHKSKIYESVSKGYSIIHGDRNEKYSATKLCWNYFIDNKDTVDIIDIINANDLYKFNLEKYSQDDCKAFNYGSLLFDMEPTASEWFELFNNNDRLLNNIINKGKICTEFNQIVLTKLFENTGFPIIFEGLNTLAINTNIKDITLLSNINNYDMFMFFRYNGKKWSVSMRTTSDNIDLSEIAKKYGGNGHPKASGFAIDDVNIILSKKIQTNLIIN